MPTKLVDFECPHCTGVIPSGDEFIYDEEPPGDILCFDCVVASRRALRASLAKSEREFEEMRELAAVLGKRAHAAELERDELRERIAESEKEKPMILGVYRSDDPRYDVVLAHDGRFRVYDRDTAFYFCVGQWQDFEHDPVVEWPEKYEKFSDEQWAAVTRWMNEKIERS